MSIPTSEDGFDSETPPLFNVMKVSSRRSAFFYVDLAKKYFWTEEKLEISGLGQGTFCYLLLLVVIEKPDRPKTGWKLIFAFSHGDRCYNSRDLEK